MDTTKVNRYEDPRLEGLDIMRPGGFELTRRLLELACALSPVPGGRVLDAGCGTGAVAAYLAALGFDVTGVDKSETLIERGRAANPGVPLICARVEELPFADKFFDIALFECSLSLMDADAALTETRRVLRPGGTLLISDIFSGAEGVLCGELNVRPLSELMELLSRHDFVATCSEDATHSFTEFTVRLIMSTGSVDALFDCGQWSEIKHAKPRYLLVTAKNGACA